MEVIIQSGWAYVCGIISSALWVYVKKRLEGLATLADMRAATDIQEQVKSGYSRALEDHRQDIWLDQQRLVVFREDYRQRFEFFNRTLRVVTAMIKVVDQIQVLQVNREVFRMWSSFHPDADSRDKYTKLYIEYRELVIEAGKQFQELAPDLGELKAAGSVFFDDVAPRLLDIEEKAYGAAQLHWTETEFDSRMRHFLDGGDSFKGAADKVKKDYRVVWDAHMFNDGVDELYRDMREKIRSSREQALSGRPK